MHMLLQEQLDTILMFTALPLILIPVISAFRVGQNADMQQHLPPLSRNCTSSTAVTQRGHINISIHTFAVTIRLTSTETS
jgi:hypothetical protein